MSGANADRRDTAASIDEWRVDRSGAANQAAPPPPEETHWSPAGASLRRAQVRDDLQSWREELTERIERLERRLTETPESPG